MEETISLQEIFGTIKQRFLLIAVITILATLISGVVSYFVMTPIYQTSTQILVNQSKSQTNNTSLNYSDIQTNVQLINTYSVIIKSPKILDAVSKQLGTTVAPDNVSINSAQNSQVFTVTVKDPSPAKAMKIANSIASVFQSQIQVLMNVDNVSILSQATLPTSPVKPNPKLNMAIAFVVGLMIGVGLAFLLEYLDTSIKDEEDITNLLELPVLGVIAEFDPTEAKVPERQKMSRVRGEKYEA